uniref:Multidrug resistance-associated protein lethal(2)03659 n=4 Tax=Photinus pyralis TaxID=7054 RepID=A0A1Y1K348_PHOPY
MIGKMLSKTRLKTASKTDERVCLMNEIILGIQVIKMYTWERPFTELAQAARSLEIRCIKISSIFKGIMASFIMFSTRSSLFLTILGYVLFGNAITAQKVFMLTNYYNVLRLTMTVFFPQGLAFLAETKVSIQRLTEFLLHEEVAPRESVAAYKRNADPNSQDIICVEKGTAKWTDFMADNIFSDLNINVRAGSLVAIIGPVGCGKSSILQALLKELPLKSGTLTVKGTVSYASQEPWLFTGSLRQNILFGQNMDKIRYKTVVDKCALRRDFTLLSNSDKTVVGERGASLSGGQRARINLARAVYKRADIYLLDDPLSAVDPDVGKQLFKSCIKEFLRHKTVILVTHQLQYLQDVDHIIIIDNGYIQAQGTFRDLQASGLNFAKLLTSENDFVEVESAEAVNRRMSIQMCAQRKDSIVGMQRKMSVQLASQRRESIISIQSDDIMDPGAPEEKIVRGSVSGSVYTSYLKAGGNYLYIVGVILLILATQCLASFVDYFIAVWVNIEHERSIGFTDEHFRNRTIYFSTESAILIYSGVSVALILTALTRSCAFFVMCATISQKLHNSMFNNLIRTTMGFFNTNNSGVILNRFSKDIGAIDERLPLALMDVLQLGMSLLSIITIIATVNYWLIIPTLVIFILFYFLRMFFLTTSRNIKRLEGVTRSPVFGHLNASLQGLTTIRAFGAQQILEKEFDGHQDLHSSAFYTFISISTAFGYFLDLFCVVYIATVTVSFLLYDTGSQGGNVGLAITQALGLTALFQWTLRQTAELENQMTSVERVLEYTHLVPEPIFESEQNQKPPPTWPERGEVKFVDLSMSYFPEDPPTLKHLSFTIKPLEKVGIVGRTGAGKSSLISALFLLAPTEGAIVIDDVVIQDIGLEELRSKISIIPQEPVLFSGTMRSNLDPFDEYDDEVLWKALEDVELKDSITDSQLGLNSKILEGGTNYSVGQRQMICLARAIVRNNKILVLDEATANVDPQTDAFIQKTIRRKFADCTLLTIAHRLNTIMDSDKILVMDAGKLVEFDHPHNLLKNKNGYFYKMVDQTGAALGNFLKNVAQTNYQKMTVKEENEKESDKSNQAEIAAPPPIKESEKIVVSVRPITSYNSTLLEEEEEDDD